MVTQQARHTGQPANELHTNGSSNGVHNAQEERLARALGWFSIGLGLAQIAAPREFAHWIGVHADESASTTMRGIGLRELVSGVGILSQPRPAGWLWARVGGDAMDLALLSAAQTAHKNERERVSMAMAAVAGITLLDLYCSTQLSREANAHPAQGQAKNQQVVKHAITINRPPEEVYRFWHDFTNLPRFMQHLESVEVLNERRSRWQAKAPLGQTVSWEAEIVDDRPNELIAWRSLEQADVDNAGVVRFKPAPTGRGTEVHVEVQYRPPGGVIGTTVAKLFGEEPGQQTRDDLRHLKQVLETGEVVVSSATVAGNKLLQRPAQPPAAPNKR